MGFQLKTLNIRGCMIGKYNVLPAIFSDEVERYSYMPMHLLDEKCFFVDIH